MRRAITIAVVVAVTFMTFAGIVRSRAGTGPSRRGSPRPGCSRSGSAGTRSGCRPAGRCTGWTAIPPAVCATTGTRSTSAARAPMSGARRTWSAGPRRSACRQARPSQPAPAFAGPRIGSLPQNRRPGAGRQRQCRGRGRAARLRPDHHRHVCREPGPGALHHPQRAPGRPGAPCWSPSQSPSHAPGRPASRPAETGPGHDRRHRGARRQPPPGPAAPAPGHARAPGQARAYGQARAPGQARA